MDYLEIKPDRVFIIPANRDLHVLNLDIPRELLAAEAYRVDWNALTANLGDRLQIDAARIVRAITEQNHGANWERGGLGQNFL